MRSATTALHHTHASFPLCIFATLCSAHRFICLEAGVAAQRALAAVAAARQRLAPDYGGKPPHAGEGLGVAQERALFGRTIALQVVMSRSFGGDVLWLGRRGGNAAAFQKVLLGMENEITS
jgi:hypothetical protein